jgi:hypothetical protein
VIGEQAEEEAPRPTRDLARAARLAQRRPQPPPGDDLGQVRAVVVVIAGEHLVAPLAVEQHRHSRLSRHLHHAELRIDAGGGKRLVLVADERRQVGE